MFVSTDGRTFKQPPASWLPGDSAPEAQFAGTSDPLAADLIRAGATGVSANVDEPYLDGSIRPDILFPAYASGRNLAESFYAAIPYLSWQTLIIGDPLCAPFPRQPLTADAADPPIDGTTELPTEFSRRKLANVYPAISRAAVAAFMKFQSRVLRGDTAGARVALEAAIAAEPRFIPARIELALLEDHAGDRDSAIAEYRAILTYSPNDPLALNNLAYALAVYRNNPEEALPIAQRATVVAREDPTLLGGASISNYYSLGTYRREPLVPYSLDTLAWVQHLLGRHVEAANTIREALAAGGGFAPDLRWHAAIIYAAVDDMHQASAELSAAVTADPTLVNRAEIQKLQQQLSARKF
jgi:tetratricopeptide (TPR) repeat protein